MEQAIARFDDFMVLTRDSPDDAIRIFQNLGLSPSEASYSVDGYIEFRRLVWIFGTSLITSYYCCVTVLKIIS